MAIYKYRRAGGWNLNKVTNELLTGTGQLPQMALGDDGITLTIELPDQVSSSLVEKIIARTGPVDQLETAAIVTGAGNSVIGSVGIASNLPSVQQAVTPTPATPVTLIDQRWGTGDPYDTNNPFTGTWIVYPAKEYPTGSGTSYTFMEVAANVVTVGANATLAQLLAGAGAVVQDANGLTILSDTLGSNTEAIKFITSDGIQTAQINNLYTGTTPNRVGYLNLDAFGETGSSTSEAYVLITASRTGTNNRNRIQLSYQNAPFFTYLDRFDNSGTFFFGDFVSQSTIVAASTTPTAGYSRTIRANSMGTNGSFSYDVWFLVSNTGGTGVSCTFDVIFGSTTLHSQASTSTGASTPRYVMVNLKGTVTNVGSASVQNAACLYSDGGNSSDSTTLATLNKALGGQKTAAENSATNLTFKINCTLSTATNSKVQLLRAQMTGPNYS